MVCAVSGGEQEGIGTGTAREQVIPIFTGNKVMAVRAPNIIASAAAHEQSGLVLGHATDRKRAARV
jgi:hypothetical protein